MPDFKSISLRPLTGAFDTLSSADEIGFGNYRVVKNATTRSTRNRQRGGGWRRLFADDSPYNNADLHDQLTDRLGYYESFTDRAFGGGGLAGYGYPYFSPSYVVDGDVVFPPAAGPYAPVYIGDFPSGIYNGCPIFYPSVGFPYNLIPAFTNNASARAHWRFDTIAATTPDLFGGLPLTNFGPTVTTGLVGNALDVIPSTYLLSSDASFLAGDIQFGFTGWVYCHDPSSLEQHILGRWGLAGSRQYRLYLSAGVLKFEVSNNGTASTILSSAATVPTEGWMFFACWHDHVLNTINIRVDGTRKPRRRSCHGQPVKEFALMLRFV